MLSFVLHYMLVITKWVLYVYKKATNPYSKRVRSCFSSISCVVLHKTHIYLDYAFLWLPKTKGLGKL